MPGSIGHQRGSSVLLEMQEFAAFPKATQRYIRRSLDVGLRRRDAVRRWSRAATEAAAIREQYRVYRQLDEIRRLIPDDIAIEAMASLMAPLVTVSAFDLAQGWLPSFGTYRFLYERLLGAAVRPWLPAAFCAAAALPHLHPQDRFVLLQSIGDVPLAAGWPMREPAFVPEWVEKVDATIAA